jgi:hypothetical protein
LFLKHILVSHLHRSARILYKLQFGSFPLI